MRQEAMESFAFPAKYNSITAESTASSSNFHWNHLNTPFVFWTGTQREIHESKSQAT